MTARTPPPLHIWLLALALLLPGRMAFAQCGDGVAVAPEECDDGNVAIGDGCDAACALEDVTGLCAGVPASPGTDLDAVRVASGLSQPVHVTAPPLDPHRLFIVEKTGAVRILRGGALLPTPFLSLVGRVSGGPEQGLLSLAFHPTYETNRRLFVNYTDTRGNTVVARYTASAANPDVVDPGSERILLVIPQPFPNHNGGQIAFGPDGRLYVGMGDGGGADDPLEAGQSDATPLGKVLRLGVDVETPPFSAVPADNPNPGAGPQLGLIWAKGARNPWRFSFDRGSGALFLADVGQGQREEVDVLAVPGGGANLGWDVFEGSLCFEPAPLFPTCPAPPAGFTFPVHEYDHSQGCSITGGFVYRGCALPALLGTYFYADYCTAFVRTFELSGGAAVNHLDRTADLAPGGGLSIDAITSFGEDARGELYIADQGGEIFKIIPAVAPATATPTFTATPVPPTATASPTETPVPTDTPAPTATARPEPTETFVAETPTAIVAPATATATPTTPPPPTPCRGDVNGDGRVTPADAVLVSRAMFTMPGMRRWNSAADVNGNGYVEPFDLAIVILHLFHPRC